MTTPYDHGVVASVASAAPNILRELIQLSMSRTDLVSFAGGLPAEELFDVEGLDTATLSATRSNTRAPWQYANTEGLPSLRERLAELCRQRAISASAGRMIVTSGSQQAIDVTTRVLVSPGDAVLVERPTFITALQTFRAAQAHLVGFHGDSDGPDPDALEEAIAAARAEGRAVKLIYLVPNFSNPAGRVTSLARRHAILEIASRQAVTILEDDPYGELWFGEPPPPTLRALAEPAGLADRVIYVSSLSKTVSPGLRVGWVLLPEALMQPFRLVKSTADVHSSVLSQAVADAYLAQDRLASRIALSRRSYATKARTMADALAAKAPAIAFEQPPGGMFLWAQLPEGCSAIAFARHALEAEGVAVVPGDPFYESHPDTARLRLSFSQGTPATLKDGVDRIAAAWRGWRRE